MQVRMSAQRFMKTGFLNPAIPVSKKPEEAVAPEQPNGFDFTGVDWDTFDWDSWEMPTLGDGGPRWRRELDPGEYRKKKMEVTIRNFKEIEDRVRAHYQPEYDKIKGMSKEQMMDYLWDTYQKPFSTKVLDSRPPNGMTRREAEMAYNQLMHLYLYNTTFLLADSYALSPSDIRDLNTAESRAVQEVDQYFKDAWDAAHPDYDPEKEKAQRKAAFRTMVETIRRTSLHDLPSGACLSEEVLSLPADEPGETFSARA